MTSITAHSSAKGYSTVLTLKFLEFVLLYDFFLNLFYGYMGVLPPPSVHDPVPAFADLLVQGQLVEPDLIVDLELLGVPAAALLLLLQIALFDLLLDVALVGP